MAGYVSCLIGIAPIVLDLCFCDGYLASNWSSKQNINPENEKYLTDRDRTRTCNLLIRSQTPYPLGHAVHLFATGKVAIISE